MRGAIRPTTPAEAVERARSMIGYVPAPHVLTPAGYQVGPIEYRLEPGYNGGANPDAAHPASWSFGYRTPTADCVGLVAWAMGFDRYQPDGRFPWWGGWVNTNSMIADATRTRTYFEQIPAPELGCAIVYETQGGTIGHVGLVVDPLPAEWGGNWRDLRVIDCAASHSRRHRVAREKVRRMGPDTVPGPQLLEELRQGAIRERSGELWGRRGGMFLRYRKANR